MSRQLARVVRIVVVAALFATPTFATNSGQQMDFQGRLTDGSGVPSNSTPQMVFAIWTAATGGTNIWEETHSAVTITDGVFNVRLGSVDSPLDFREDAGNQTTPVFDGSNRFLEIKVGTETLSPRVQLTSAGFALNVGHVDISEATSTPQVKLNKTSGSGNVVDVTNAGSGNALSVSQSGSATAVKVNRTSGASDYLDIQNNGTSVLKLDGNGDLGIGTSPGAFTLDVKGPNSDNAVIAHFYSSTSARGAFIVRNGSGTSPTAYIGTHGSTEQLAIGSCNAEAIRINASQQVGIGESSPAQNGPALHVKRDVGGDNAFVAVIENTNTTNGDGLKILIADSDSDAENDFVEFYDNTGAVGTIEGISGTSGNQVAYQTTGNDFAEYFAKIDPRETTHTGQIVYVVGNRISVDPQSAWNTVGVVSADAGFVGGKPYVRVPEAEKRAIEAEIAGEYDAETYRMTRDGEKGANGRSVDRDAAIRTRTMDAIHSREKRRTMQGLDGYGLVTLLGRVRVDVKGGVNAGDYISFDGTAIAPDKITFEQYRKCVGKALESGSGQVLCLVGVR